MTESKPPSGPEASAERGITPVAGNPHSSLPGRGAVVFAAVALGALVLWGTWRTDKPEEPVAKVVVRQTTPFEAARDPAPKPDPPARPATVPPERPPVPTGRSPAEDLLDGSRRAPLLAYNRPPSLTGTPGHGRDSYPDHSSVPYGLQRDVRDELADRLKPTPLEGVRAARLLNRHMVVAQGAAIPCVLETAMSSDVPGFVSCTIGRDVRSDSGHVVLMEKGTQVVGEYRGSLRRGARRLFVLWTRAKTPTGVIVNLASPATDALGRSGFDGVVDTHFFERFGAALLLSLVGGAGDRIGEAAPEAEIEIRAARNLGNNAAAIAADRSIDLPPTLTKNQGELVNIVVARDLDFSSVYRLHVVGPPSQAVDRAGGRQVFP